MVTKNQFIEQLHPIKCSICLDGYNSEHVPVELSCGHIFGDHCIVEQTEIRTANNNRCPLCRQELFEQEDFASTGDALYDSDEPLIEFDDYDDSTDEEEMDTEEEQRRQTLAALLHAHQTRHAQPLNGASLAGVTTASRRERHSHYQEFMEHAARTREMSRAFAPKSPRRTETYNDIEEEPDSGSDGSEYEPEEDDDSADEREEKHAYRLLPGEHETTLPNQPSVSQ